MIGIFAFDGPMYCDCNGTYCNTTITNEMFSRYFTVVSKLYVLIRTIHLNDTYINLNLKKVEVDDKLEIVELPNLNSPLLFLSRHKFIYLIDKYVLKADLIFLRVPSIISNMTASVCTKHKKPYFAEIGGCAWDSYFNHGILGKMVAPLMFLAEKKIVREATFASYVTERWLQKRYPCSCKSIVASNVYLNNFDESNIERRIERYSANNISIYKLGTIASVEVRYKGQEYVIRALGKLKKKGIIINYELVGTGNPTFLSNIAQQCDVSKQVKFLGVKLHDDIWDWLDSIDIYIQPSKQEGLPRALIEAMNRGCLTAGSNIAGIPELLEAASIFRSGNVDDICDVISVLIDEKNHEKRIRRNFEHSKKFRLTGLESRRNDAFNEYKNYCIDYDGKR